MTDHQVNKIVLIVCAIFTAICLVAACTARGDDDRDHHDRDHNYIIERQQAYQVEGVPTSRIIDGRREIDIYPNGQMFEGNHLVGVRSNDDDDNRY